MRWLLPTALAAAAGRVLAEELADEPHRWELHAAALQKVARTGRLCDDQVLARCEADPQSCLRRTFEDGQQRPIPRTTASAEFRLRWTQQLTEDIHGDSKLNAYVIGLLTELQAECGAVGDLGHSGCKSDNGTRAIWSAVTLGRREGERAFLARSGPSCDAGPAFSLPAGAKARFLIVSDAESAESAQRNLEASAEALVPGGVLAVEGLHDMHTRPHLQEGFHAFMQANEANEEPADALPPEGWLGDLCAWPRPSVFVPFLRMGVLILMARSGYAEAYRAALEGGLPQDSFIDHHKYMYGGEILISTSIRVPKGTLWHLYLFGETDELPSLWAFTRRQALKKRGLLPR